MYTYPIIFRGIFLRNTMRSIFLNIGKLDYQLNRCFIDPALPDNKKEQLHHQYAAVLFPFPAGIEPTASA